MILSGKSAVKPRELDPSDFAAIGRTAEVEGESSSMKETAKTMMQEEEIHPFPEEEEKDEEDEDDKKPEVPGAKTDVSHRNSTCSLGLLFLVGVGVPLPLRPTEKAAETSTAAQQTTTPPLPPTQPQSSGSREITPQKRGGVKLPALPPRAGMGSSRLSKTGGSSSSAPTPPKPTPPPAAEPQAQPSSQPRSLPPAGIGPSGGLPPLRNQPPPVQHPRPTAMPALPPMPSSDDAARPPPVSNGGEGSSAAVEAPDVVESRRKLLDIRLTVLRIAARLGMRPLDFAINDFMSKIDRTEQLRFRGPGMIRPQLDTLFSQAVAMDERSGTDSNLDITVTAVVLGPCGSGKTSVIRNLLHPGYSLAPEFADGETTKISIHSGKICGVTLKLIDTPGLSVAAASLRHNMKTLKAIRGAITKYKPDTVIYVDRMDLFRRELSDIPLLRLVNDMLPELLYNCIALLTHASAPPPDAGHGIDMAYSEYQRLRLDLCTQILSHAISDMRWAGRPLGFENHPNCAVNSDGVPVLPSGLAFKKHVRDGLQNTYAICAP